jgi:hypothetical protein
MKRKPEEMPSLRNVKTLLTPVERCNQETIAKLEDLLSLARAGEIISIAGIADCGGSYFVYATRTLSRLEMAGALLDAAVSRLGYTS